MSTVVLLPKSPVTRSLVPNELEALELVKKSFNQAKQELETEEAFTTDVIVKKILELVTDDELKKVFETKNKEGKTMLFCLVQQALHTGEKASVCESGYAFIGTGDFVQIQNFANRINKAADCIKHLALFYAHRSQPGICLTLTLF